jgi:tRNA-modifying protein YgfZ
VTAPGPLVSELEERLGQAGALRARAAALELSRILAGWPRLGAEVDAKTIPQEVRYDEIGGVSYTKGCYTGQETVSRLHFRGHTTRELRGLEFDAEPPALEPLVVTDQDHDAGRVTSVAGLPDGRWVGLGVLRRDVALGAVVRAGEVTATVTALPLPLARRRLA